MLRTTGSGITVRERKRCTNVPPVHGGSKGGNWNGRQEEEAVVPVAVCHHNNNNNGSNAVTSSEWESWVIKTVMNGHPSAEHWQRPK